MNAWNVFLNRNMYQAARDGHLDIVKILKKWGATDFDSAMEEAARGGHFEIVKACREWGATDFDGAMAEAAFGGHLEIVKACKEWGATDFDEAMEEAASSGHLEIVKVCKEWGATSFDWTMANAAEYGHFKIIKACKEWLYGNVHQDLFKLHHKRKFYKRVHAQLLPITWHPDRVIDWCFDEDDKKYLKKLWRAKGKTNHKLQKIFMRIF